MLFLLRKTIKKLQQNQSFFRYSFNHEQTFPSLFLLSMFTFILFSLYKEMNDGYPFVIHAKKKSLLSFKIIIIYILFLQNRLTVKHEIMETKKLVYQEFYILDSN